MRCDQFEAEQRRIYSTKRAFCATGLISLLNFTLDFPAKTEVQNNKRERLIFITSITRRTYINLHKQFAAKLPGHRSEEKRACFLRG